MSHRSVVELLLLLLFPVIAPGCAAMGTGIGCTQSGASRTAFIWRSFNVHSGTMQATSSDGTNYSGSYYQMTRDANFDSATLFDGWYSGWDETDWGVGPSPDSVRRYTVRVVANLASPSGSRMRCIFQLAYPSYGMLGGGGGECQLPGGEAIDVKFPPG